MVCPMTTYSRPIEVLLVEDNPGDVRLTREAFNEAQVTNHLHVVMDGLEAMDFLQRRGRHAEAPRPDLILLDLNLPGKSGREVLEKIKSDPGLRRIPVMILTSSKADQDLQRAYELHANCYIAKPLDFYQFVDIVRSIKHFWLDIVTLPSN
jgi:chemotaxis family two-component system response regulator Rcp1